MKIVNKKRKISIVLEEKEILEVVALNNSNTKVTIKCLGGTLHIEEKNLKEFDIKTEEEKAIEALDNYLRKSKKE